MIILSYLIPVFIIGTLILLTLIPLSLEINTIERNYAFRLGRFFRIRYDCFENHRGLRFFLFGCSWFKRFGFISAETKKEKKRKKPKKTKKKLLMGLILKKRNLLYDLQNPLKKGWCDLRRLSSQRLEIHLCTPDYMMNAFLALIFANWEEGTQVIINYQEENWLIFSFFSRLWVLMWVLVKFAFSRPAIRLGFFIIGSKFKE